MQESQLSYSTPTDKITKQPLVSVIMPCYNAAPFIREAIESIIHQTYKHLEIIIINDGSTDETLSIVESYVKIDSRILLINHDKNEGLVSSLNEGVVKATGEYIARMDADDVSVHNRIEILLNQLLLHPELDIVSSGFFYIDINGHRSISIKPKGILPLALKFFSFYATPVAHACALGKSECFKMFRYDENFLHSEDYDLFSRMALSDVKLYNLTLPLYYIRLHPNRVSDRFEEQQVQSHLRISERNIISYFNQKTEDYINAIAANRFTGQPNAGEIKLAMEFIKQTKRIYLTREKCSDEVVKEIEKFVNEQYVDIIIQAVKNSSYTNRMKILSIVPKCLQLLSKPYVLNYLWTKLMIKL